MQRLSEKIYRLLLVAVMFVASGTAFAQSYYGTLKGSVLDAQGAAIAGATVELTDVATRNKRTAITNGVGEYVISAIDPATFDLVVSAPNFQTSSRKGIVIATQQTITIDTQLHIGQTSETVEVSASTPLIDTSTASNGQVFDAQKLTDLPNLGRNAFLLTKLNNNVTAVGDPRFNRFQDQSGSSAISVAGGPINGNNYEIDGVPITDFSNRAVIIPSVDAVQEMKIQANTYDAEMGRTGGGNFNTLLKSGTNRLHGNLLGTTRQTNWQANTWANNFNGTGRTNQTQYTYEGSVGGPIWKDRAFFWLTEEGYRQQSPLAGTFFLPSAAMREGNFSGVSTTIYDPTNLVNGVRQPFPNNTIPASRISPIGRAIVATLPTCASCPISSTYGTTNFTRTDTLSDRADEFIGKLDFKLTEKWTANISYMHYGSKEPSGNTLGSPVFNANNLFRKVDATTVNTVYEVTPTSVLTVGWGYNRFPNFSADISSGYDQTQLGFNPSYVSALQKAAFPTISSQSLPSLGGGSSGFSVFYSRNFVVGYQKSLGRHSLKAGYVYRSISVDFTNIGNGNGSFTFNRNYTASDNTGATGGADLADLLLGLPVSATVQIATKLAINVPYHAVYLQDDYRISPRLTLNLGLRYEHEPGSHERNNNYAVGFDTTVANPLSAPGREAKGGIMFAGTNGYGNSTSTFADKVSPRVGAVFSLNEKTVVRGGYGIFWAPIPYNASANLAPGYTAVSAYTASATGYSTAYNLANPFGGNISQPVGNTLGYAQGNGSDLTTIQTGRSAPWVQQYSFDIERQLPYGVALQVGYVGSRATNLLPGNGTTFNLNQINPAAIPAGVGPCPTGTTIANLSVGTVSNPYFGNGGTGVIGGATASRSQLCKPFPTFNSINVQPSSSRSVYNSFIIKGQKNFSRGFTGLVTYTYSRNSDSTFGTSSSLNPGNGGPANIYNLDSEYSRAINDIPQRLALSGTWRLPFGRGQAYLSSNRWLDFLVGGWSVNGTLIGQSGGPLPIRQNNNVNSVLGTALARPNLVPGINPCTSGSVQERNGFSPGAKRYLNPAAFEAVTTVGTFGNAPRTLADCRGPGYRNLDASLFKDFKQWELVTFQFRAEFMNLTNTPQFALTQNNLSVGNGAFGQVPIGAINFPRLLTLGGKIIF